MTPRSTTSILLHCMTNDTMFFPISWTSPLTVASTTVPTPDPPVAGLCSNRGCRMSTARFITRAERTTWGRKSFPSPNSFPTWAIPSIKGPSMIEAPVAQTFGQILFRKESSPRRRLGTPSSGPQAATVYRSFFGPAGAESSSVASPGAIKAFPVG